MKLIFKSTFADDKINSNIGKYASAREISPKFFMMEKYQGRNNYHDNI